MTTPSGTYAIDPSHSRLGFMARHAMVTKVRGSFTDMEGTGTFDADQPTNSQFAVTIQASSIDTSNADRDEHLRGNDFFDMANFPTINFNTTEVAPAGEGEYSVTGDLTIKGVTKPITFPLEVVGPETDPFGNVRIGLEGSTVVNRKDWDLNWNAPLASGGLLVSEKITLEFDVSAIAAS